MDRAALAAGLVALLEVAEVDVDRFEGAPRAGGNGRVFGGQVIAQALQAAQRTVTGKPAHALHAAFLRAGKADRPIGYGVERDFDGRSFATRRVVARQGDQTILTLTASFQTPEEGLAHQAAMPDVPPPEELRSDAELRAAWIDRVPERWRADLLRPRPIEIRPVEPRDWTAPAPAAPRQHSWFRVVAPIGDDPALHRAALAYASDMTLLGAALLPHGLSFLSPGFKGASLDHALWLHEPFRADDWLLYATDSPWSGHARGFTRGAIFARDGRLVASVAQEGMIRRAPSPPPRA